MKKTNKIIISLSSIISISFNAINSCIMSKQVIQSDKSIINNITPPKTIDNQIAYKKIRVIEEKPNGSE
nr:hypothetical protein [Mycoplasmopsis bovis]